MITGIFYNVCRLHIVKLQVKPSDFDGMSKRSAVILDF